ncbi:glycerol kinase GlpK [Clostridium paraputrificum]|uniref:glycerol kinase GlpK n=1 Tax=Clostridium TaxID=1485 RepID=UPI000C080E4F|nr:MULTISPECIES: glycerol kinase GlpK [Clostridium]MDB2076221.1 glycerol kinase GlpK [Clostridium paraputrificum]MDB2079696.1 glycerol kinase GlpK [Clostridium paraputrificum]MDB2086089.1 glycerol kinase GlpK [Clostridium paraputrificum]MDB2099628.1 glycerol kinase GlpK [Clostridium paraputrificum]MDU1032073.1 glycerol kinase GlpK [Clostridium sp.]
MKKYIIALDQGTTSSRAIVFDKNQNILGVSQKEITQIYPKEGWVEHNPMEIWASQYGVLQEVMAKINISPKDIAAIGITNQRETTIVWDKTTGEPIYNAIVWQCRRTSKMIDQLKDSGIDKYVQKKTGLIPDAYFSATKIKWILDNVEGAREKADRGELLFGTVDTWLTWKMTEGEVHVTDYTNASRTMLYNIRELKWDEELLRIFNIPLSMLPQVKSSSEVYGYTSLKEWRVPIAGIAGDQQAALFGQTAFNKGEAKNTYGTGCFLLMNTGEELVESKEGLLTTIAIGIENKVQYALEGSVFVGGAVIQWLRDELKLISDASDSEYFASKVKDNGGVYLVPAFVGLGAPYWDMYARGTIFGLTRGTNKNHIIRAALESIAYQSKEVMETMEKESNIKIKRLKVDGGASRNKLLMQFQSDIMNIEVSRPIITETTALGAAYLAGLAVGFWKDRNELSKGWYESERYYPNMAEEEINKLYSKWKKAVERSLGWEE